MKSPATSNCALCDGTGWRPVQKGEWRAVEPCSCQTPQRDADWYMERARVPRGFWAKDFGDFYDLGEPTLQMALIKSRGFVDNYPLIERGLLFLGPPGVGKTHLTVAILRHLMVDKRVESLFCSYQELLRQIRDSYNPVSLSTEAEVLQPVLETELVAIDDLGAERISDWVEDTVTHILNHRYHHKKITILTSNLPETPEDVTKRSPSGKIAVGDTFTQRIGPRVRSRLYEMCETLQITAKDYREQVAQHGHRGRTA